MKSSTYNLCKILMHNGLTVGLQDKLDTFYGVGRLSVDEYTELTAELAGGAAE